MLRRLLTVLTAAIVLAGALTLPAEAGPRGPGAPYVIASTPHSITLKWSTVKGARSYRVSYSRSFGKAASPSAATKSTKGRKSTLRITGLRAGKIYCFSVRAVGRTGASARSSRHCHSTMRRPNKTGRPTASIATYNVCVAAKGCRNWERRRDAAWRQIVKADADIVVLQESAARYKQLRPQWKAAGYRDAGGLLYRTKRFDEAQEIVTRKWCPSGSPDSCETITELRPVWGFDYLRHRNSPPREVASTGLRDKLTNQEYLVVNTHFTAGRTKSSTRSSEARQLLRFMRKHANGRPVIVAGDFNSDRTRDDTVGEIFATAGLHDAYQRSATYTRPYLNSYNDYRRTPRRNTRWGGHIDRIFVGAAFGVTDWAVVADTRRGKYVGQLASDHNPVRATLFLPRGPVGPLAAPRR